MKGLITIVCFLLLVEVAFSQQKGFHTIEYLSNSYDIYAVALDKEYIRLFWKDDGGNLLNNFAGLKDYVERSGGALICSMNGGIFMENLTPLGMYIENGRKVVPLNTRTSGHGNFYMQPNGVFYLTGKKAGIVETSKVMSVQEITFATQSGPMLVIDGKINPKFSQAATSKLVRNGVGIVNDSTVVFAISNTSVNFHEFASFFRDKLNCNSALYFDGVVSDMYVRDHRQAYMQGRFGCMVGVLERR